MAATIKDIAKKVGVSPSTVSRVINGSAVISDETRKKIVSAMEELDYHPNSLARNLANGNAYAIGLVIDAQDENTFSNAFFNRSVYAIEKVAQDKGYNLLITNDRSMAGASAVEKLMLEKKVDGLILPTSSATAKLVKLLKNNNFPFVVLGEPISGGEDVSWVDINNAMGSEIAVKHLKQNGYKRAAILVENKSTVFARNRIEGYVRSVKECGLRYSEQDIADCGTEGEKTSRIIECMLAEKDRPDAFLCSNNIIAFQVLKALKSHGIGVPEEIGLVTFDNYPIAEYMDPPLTAVDVDTFSLGEQAASMLLNKIRRMDQGNQQIVISPGLIERDSSRRGK